MVLQSGAIGDLIHKVAKKAFGARGRVRICAIIRTFIHW